MFRKLDLFPSSGVVEKTPTLLGSIDQCFSTAGPRPGTGPSSYRKKTLPGRGVTKVENHCLRHILRVQWLRLALSKWPKRVGVSPHHLKTEIDPVSETLFSSFLEYKTTDKYQKKTSNSDWSLHLIYQNTVDLSYSINIQICLLKVWTFRK
jgi:hypothetical protein